MLVFADICWHLPVYQAIIVSDTDPIRHRCRGAYGLQAYCSRSGEDGPGPLHPGPADAGGDCRGDSHRRRDGRRNSRGPIPVWSAGTSVRPCDTRRSLSSGEPCPVAASEIPRRSSVDRSRLSGKPPGCYLSPCGLRDANGVSCRGGGFGTVGQDKAFCKGWRRWVSAV
jgi:hypothetical protein